MPPPDPHPDGPAWLQLLLQGSGKLALVDRMLQASGRFAASVGPLSHGEGAAEGGLDGRLAAPDSSPWQHLWRAPCGAAMWRRQARTQSRLGPLLQKLRTGGHRVLVYSQFLLMLDVLEWYCAARGFSYLRLDGSVGEGHALRGSHAGAALRLAGSRPNGPAPAASVCMDPRDELLLMKAGCWSSSPSCGGCLVP